ncbi:MAG: DEAD/DEAH box helicase [Alphaproteobacteria bacterium]|nr:DEAD/DEAH box helicase [Alphaproteobacteria bacterium]
MNYRGYTLDPFQQHAIEALQRGETVLVCAPTGTGKTVVADWMVEEVIGRGKEVVYTAPIKALSNQKYRDYCKLLGEDKVGLVTGDLVIRPDAQVRVMTTEILRNQLLMGEEVPHLDAVIIDEIHFLDDPERGTVWEELLIYLPEDIQVVGLSATLANLQEFAAWLRSVRGHEVTVVEEHTRAVPLEFLVATREGGLKDPGEMRTFFKAWQAKASQRGRAGAKSKREKKGHRGQPGRHGRTEERLGHPTRHHDVFSMLAPDLLPFMYFVQSRKDAESLAASLGQRVGQGYPPSLLEEDEAAQVVAAVEKLWAEPGGRDALPVDLARLYRMGIAYHHAGLHVVLKALVEELYERRLIRVLYCTGTFALGINMPARCAVFDTLERYNGQEMIPLPSREFMQMAGRAGRRGMDDAGLVVVRCDIDDWPGIEKELKRYLRGDIEPVRSRFSLSLHSVVHLLEQYDEARVRELVDKSFLSFHRAHQAEEWADEADQIARGLRGQGWVDGGPAPGSMKREIKRLHKLKARAEQRMDATWTEFQQKVEWLERWGYIRRPGEGEEAETPSGWVLGAGAMVLREMQFQEVLTTELVLEGVLSGLSMAELFGVLCGMVNSLPRGVVVRGAPNYRGLGRHIHKIRMGDAVTTSEFVTRQEVTWDPDMIVFGVWWAEGQPLAEIMERVDARTDIAGDLVGAFRRARDLAQQLMAVYRRHDPDRAAEIRQLLKDTRRDEVEVLD